MNKDFNYKLVRSVGVPFFNKMLHPTIIDKEYIPESGPIILCGNHLHVWDQFPVICATKRVTHWMAKKEYFDSKLGPFFKATGSICVDREGDASLATNEALDYLSKGSAIGIFPEGTRNKYRVLENKLIALKNKVSNLDNIFDTGMNEYLLDKNDNEVITKGKKLMALKNEIIKTTSEIVQIKIEMEKYKETLKNKGIIINEDDLLLPLHYGAVSMANKSNALIVPFGVTGDYTKDNDNLVVRFAEPIKPSDDLEHTNELLHDEIVRLVKKNYNEYGRSKK